MSKYSDRLITGYEARIRELHRIGWVLIAAAFVAGLVVGLVITGGAW